MYTTNAIESINSSLRKVTRKGSFPNENAVLKLLYLRITELEKGYSKPISNWTIVRYQLNTNENFKEHIIKYQ